MCISILISESIIVNQDLLETRPFWGGGGVVPLAPPPPQNPLGDRLGAPEQPVCREFNSVVSV